MRFHKVFLCALCQTSNLYPVLSEYYKYCPRSNINRSSREVEESWCPTRDVRLVDLQASMTAACHWCRVLWRLVEDNVVFKGLHVDSTSSIRLTFSIDILYLQELIVRVDLLQSNTETLLQFVGSVHVQTHSHAEVPEIAPVESEQDTIDRYAMLIEQQLRQCHKSHHKCAEITDQLLPSRVLDVCPEQSFAGTGPNSVRLHETRKDRTGFYTALSYCWGGEHNLRLTSVNRLAYLDRISFSDLPKTIKDAVLLTRALKVRYLWVDALCIIQDLPRDKDEQMQRMREIFSTALVTIVASQARTVFQGFIHHATPFVIPKRTFGYSKHAFIEFTMPYYTGFCEPIESRAWTLEERLLSPRLATFTARGLSWECQAGSQALEIHSKLWYVDERGHRRTKSRDRSRIKSGVNSGTKGHPGPYNKQVPKLWNMIVSDYTSRLLTHTQDKLPAISGVAAAFTNAWGAELGRYHAGLWSRCAADGLAWYTERSWGDLHKKPRAILDRAPTWSWASIDDPVVFLNNEPLQSGSYKRTFRVLGLETAQVHPSVHCGTIQLQKLAIESPALDDELGDCGSGTRSIPHLVKSLTKVSLDTQQHLTEDTKCV